MIITDSAYDNFLSQKSQTNTDSGFIPTFLPEVLFDFQQHLVEWAVKKGRAALFCDCGLGKTLMQLVWAQNVVEHTNKPVLILTPLSVVFQTIEEAAKFNISCMRGDANVAPKGIVVTNYEQLHKFNKHDFAAVVCDESSILKNFDGTRRAHITEFMREHPYRLLCTATASPNDYIELGTSSEALGYLGNMDMLGMFFKNDEHSLHPMWHGSKWRFKKHAEVPFWRWVCSWARAVRRPSDLGFSDDRFVLPELIERETVIDAPPQDRGYLFDIPAINMQEQREERHRTIGARCEHVAQLASGHNDSFVSWCHLNEEGDLLEELIPHAVQVSGADSDEEKEEKFIAFTRGHVQGLITKPKIGSFGMNWQHCHRETFFPSHSFEQYYQGVRRCWRFGQLHPVTIDIIGAPGDISIMKNIRRKAEAADVMFTELVKHMNDALHVNRSTYGSESVRQPEWL